MFLFKTNGNFCIEYNLLCYYVLLIVKRLVTPKACLYILLCHNVVAGVQGPVDGGSVQGLDLRRGQHNLPRLPRGEIGG